MPPLGDDASPGTTNGIYCSVAQGDAAAYICCTYMSCNSTGGRRPEGLACAQFEGPDEGARFLAQMAYLEAASVDAFVSLTHELEAHRAPTRLRAASRRAARDEVRHARVMRRLARRAGARVPEVQVEPSPVRSLEEIAIENAIEGCVRETFGAAVAMIQSERAGDARVRRGIPSRPAASITCCRRVPFDRPSRATIAVRGFKLHVAGEAQKLRDRDPRYVAAAFMGLTVRRAQVFPEPCASRRGFRRERAENERCPIRVGEDGRRGPGRTGRGRYRPARLGGASRAEF